MRSELGMPQRLQVSATAITAAVFVGPALAAWTAIAALLAVFAHAFSTARRLADDAEGLV